MSDSETTRQPLFKDFPPVSTEEWEQVISRDLKGADYRQKLRWQTGEGVTPLPFYRREDFEKLARKQPLEKAGDRAWSVREMIYEQDISSANRSARRALERGADSLQFFLQILYTDGSLGGDLAGTAIQNQQDFNNLLEGIDLNDASVHFDGGLATPALLAMVWNHLKDDKTKASECDCTFTYDPFRFILLNGRLPKKQEDFQHDITQMAAFARQNLPGARPLCIDARTYHNTGATLVEELGFAMAAASEYLAILTDNGIDASGAARQLHFQFSVGSGYFLEVAKFRALRLLWEQLLHAYGADPQEVPAYIHAESSRRNKTLYDPYNNMIRATTEGMSAAIGGCDSMTILPFDETFRASDSFSQRIARNTQIIMSDEAYLNRVKDPAAGSYYIEQLTEDIAREAWSFFTEVEKTGGMTKAILENFVQSTIEHSQQERVQAITNRGRIFVGTNKYPNPEDRMHEKYQPDQPTVSLDDPEGGAAINADHLISEVSEGLQGGKALKDFIPYLFDLQKHDIRQLQPFNEAEPFEKLRLATEQHERTPVVLTLPIGDRRIRKARSSFAANFFGCAGYHVEDPIGYDDAEEAFAEMVKQSPEIVVLCSADENYGELIPAAFGVMDEIDDPPLLVVAGKSQPETRQYRTSGEVYFINRQSNTLETLQAFHHKLKILE